VVSEDEGWMAKALALAERGRATTSPNPMVGALVVSDEGVVVGRGSHRVAGGPHAEAFAFEDAGDRAAGATLYCTLEPCSHVGRTGPCAPRVVASGIRRAVIAMEDPNPLVAGRGLALLRTAGIETVVGIGREEAARLNAPFLSRVERRRPLVILKAGLSADGRVSAGAGQRTPLTSPASNRRVHRDRAEVDAVAIGSGTVLADDPLLTPRGAFRPRPLVRVVFDRRLRTPPTARLLSTLDHGPVIIVTGSPEAAPDPRAAELLAAGAEIVAVPGGAPFVRGALEALAARGISSVVVEGGPILQRACWDAGVVDRVQMYMTPRVMGEHGVRWLALAREDLDRLTHVRVLPLGPDALVEGDVHGAG
jgi:diaminohydroxyphosphoribosylaminopyrimidine deaminase/5-amino-6-(5-phosphoribosylamino)uracil reductase